MRGLVMAVVLCASSALAHAGGRLDYQRVDARCPDRDELVRMVAERLDYDPLAGGADFHVRVTLSARRARIEILDGGVVVGARTVRSRSAGCGELARAAALAVAIAIDPALAFRSRDPAPSPAPIAAPSSMPSLAAAHVPPVAPPRGEAPGDVPAVRTDLYVGAGVVAVFGAAPRTGAGATVQVGVRRGWASLSLEGRLDQESGVEFGPGQVHASLRFGALVPCAHHGALSACGVVAAGALHGRPSGLVDPTEADAAFVGAGARLSYEVGITRGLSARVHADALAAVVRAQLTVSEMPAWTQPPWSAAVGIGAVGYFQ